MFKFVVTNDEGLAIELEAKPRDILRFERETQVKLSDLEEGLSFADLYHLAWVTFRRVDSVNAPKTLKVFEEGWDVDPVVEREDADPTNAEA
ncbi:hypothetical protein [Amycolatopsis sp. NPDC051903]|uniref:hypothetical protein n=1 Tax=Amycolatopsis sp. NPDC051903 TaxID=3363936 RepID=UPI0037B8EE52